MLISKHFTVDEFRCHSGEGYPEAWINDRLNALCGVLDPLRDAWGGQLVTVCGYRSAAYNEALRQASAARNGGVSGVATNSQHVQGRAADVRPLNPNVASVLDLRRLALELYAAGKLPRMGGLGYYPGLWIHVDVRRHAPGELAQWNGSGSGSDR